MPESCLTLVSLGPDDPGYLTQEAIQAMRTAHRLILRTARHGAADFLRQEGIAFESLDSLYGQAEDFDELTKLAAEQIGKALQEGDVCYAVSDVLRDGTVPGIAAKAGCIRYVAGVSLGESAAFALTRQGLLLDRLFITTALALDGIRPEAKWPQAITEIDTRELACDVKLWLSDLFDEEMTVYFCENAGEACPEVKSIPLYELDRQSRYDHRTCVLVPPSSFMDRQRASYEDFADIVRILRGPDGCPWDREQTHESLRRYLLEEAAEAADAMNGEDPDKLCDELGDVLLQVVLNAQAAADHGNFSDRDVTTAIARKMIRRHPHVFGKAHVDSADETHAIWEQVKHSERGDQSLSQRLSELPSALPALLRAQKVASREKDAGLVHDGDREKVLSLLSDAELDRGALGEILFRLARMAEESGLDAEGALAARIQEEIKQC